MSCEDSVVGIDEAGVGPGANNTAVGEGDGIGVP